MKRYAVVTFLFCAALVWAGIPPSEGGLRAPNDSLVIPRKLTVNDAGRVTNVDMSTVHNPAQFNIPATAPLFVQCPDAGAWVYTDVTAMGPGLGTMVAAGGAYQTACYKNTNLTQADGGLYYGCVIVIAPLAGNVNAQCIVHSTRGSF